MALSTFPAFNYGHLITKDNFNIAFDEGAGELTASIAIGDYTLGELAVAVQTALNAVSVTNTFSVAVDRSDSTFDITADTSAFSLLVSSGSTAGTSAFSLLGFTGADLTGSLTYSGNERSGKRYISQTLVQNYKAPEDFQEAIQSSVNESASGVVETVNFGRRKLIEFDIPFITDIVPQDGKVIKSRANGVADARDLFLNETDGLINKGRFEFVPDVNTPSTFHKVILERTPESSDGTGFRLKERVGDNLPGYFETGLIRLRVVD